MSRPLPLSILVPSVFLSTAFSGCATYRGCSAGECTSDQQLNSEVARQLDRYPELVGTIPITVQTKGGIVYFNGMVATDLQRDTAESVALKAAGIAMVVNGIAVTEK